MQKNSHIRTLIKQLLAKYDFLEISHIHKIVIFKYTLVIVILRPNVSPL